MIPPFEMEGGPLLALLRFAFVAALLAAFGTALFGAVVLPRALHRADGQVAARSGRHLITLLGVELGAALLGWAGWLVAQAAEMAGADGIGPAVAAVGLVLRSTSYGHLALVQVGLLLCAGLLLGVRPVLRPGRIRSATALLAVALGAQAGHGHAWSMYGGPSLLLVAGVVHLLAAGGWLGGLVPLLLLVRNAPVRVAAAGARWFSPLGKWCVGGIVVSSAWQFWDLIGGLPGLLGTAYGWVAAGKFVLFGVLLAFAALNRYRLAPALLGTGPAQARRTLIGALAVQTGFGVLCVVAAGVLGSLPPSMHLQPVWPFPLRPSLNTVNEDPGFRDEVVGAVLGLIGAVCAIGLAVVLRRRLRWAAWLPVMGAVALGVLALPHLGLLLVQAYPTSYARSPTGFAAQSIADGAGLFPQHCAACHGVQGRGDGPAAAGLPVPPADLTAEHLWMHEDGELFWWLTHGIEAPEGGVAMPGFAEALSADQRWALIDYIRAHNAGLVAAATDNWAPPLQAPGLQAECSGGGSLSLADARGGFVRLVFGAGPPSIPPPIIPGVTTILAGPTLPAPTASDPCVARDPAVVQAYAVVSGVAPAALPGTQFLIDGNGWLRAMQRPGTAGDWDDPATLQAVVRQLQAHPIATDAGPDHAHMRM